MKKNWTKIMAVGMVMTMLGGMVALANERGAVVAPAPTAKTEDVIAEEEDATFLTQSGKVLSVESSETEGVSIVEIENEQGGLRFALDASDLILDRKDGAHLTVADLTKGMEVAVIYDANGPMGLSLPPYLGKVTAVVANADAGSYEVGRFDADLTDLKLMLQLNIDPDSTVIADVRGTKQKLSEEDVKGRDALVFYDITTRSIPAQTNPSFVLILSQNEEEPAAEPTAEPTTAPTADPAAEPEMQAQILLPLRQAAVEKGYTVTWQGKEKPILLTKDGVSMEITLGRQEYVVDGDQVKKAAVPSELRDGVAYVSGDIFAE